MRKKRFVALFLVVLILSMNFSAAEEQVNDYNSFSTLDFDFSINGGFTLEATSDRSKISEVTSYLTFFPREDTLQEIKDLNFNSKPLGTISKNTDEVVFNWASPKPGAFEISVDSQIKIHNAMMTVDKKIDFPLKNVETFYTQPTEFIDITDEIRAKADEIANGEDDLYVVSFKIADWIQENVKYDLTTLTADVVQKSSWVLKNREGVCDELTNLFISMMRSLGVPARYVSGIAYTNVGYKFGPHAWAEVYFPDKGWVPFDITYKQFGWVDPSHIKLKVSADSGDPTIRYTWKSIDTNIKGKRIDIDAQVTNKGDIISPPVVVEVNTLANTAGPGSYIPFEVVLKNPNNYYFPMLITVTKANSLTEKNSKEVLLKPGETKRVYWTSVVPNNLETGYIYKSTFEVEDQFHFKYATNISYSKNVKTLSKEEAEAIIKEEMSKYYSDVPSINLVCSSTKYSFVYEAPSIICKIKNKSSRNLQNMRICVEKNCKSVALQDNEEKEIELKLATLKEGIHDLEVSAVADGFTDKDIVSIEVLSNPDLVISDIFYPNEVDYDTEVQFDTVLNVKALVKDVRISVNNNELVKVQSLEGSKKASLKFNSKELVNNEAVNLRIDFKDKNGKEYSITKDYPVKVDNVPFFVKVLKWFKL